MSPGNIQKITTTFGATDTVKTFELESNPLRPAEINRGFVKIPDLSGKTLTISVADSFGNVLFSQATIADDTDSTELETMDIRLPKGELITVTLTLSAAPGSGIDIEVTLYSKSISGGGVGGNAGSGEIDDGTAQGQLAFWDATEEKWVNTETTEAFWDDTEKKLGIGTATPAQKLDIKGSVNIQSTENLRQLLITGDFDLGNNIAISFKDLKDNSFATIGFTTNALRFSNGPNNNENHAFLIKAEKAHASNSSNLYGVGQLNAEIPGSNGFPAFNALLRNSTPTSVDEAITVTTWNNIKNIIMAFDATTIFNDQQNDADFTIKAVGETHAFFLQGSDGFLGLNTGTPTSQLDVNGDTQLRGYNRTNYTKYLETFDFISQTNYGEHYTLTGATNDVTSNAGKATLTTAASADTQAQTRSNGAIITRGKKPRFETTIELSQIDADTEFYMEFNVTGTSTHSAGDEFIAIAFRKNVSDNWFLLVDDGVATESQDSSVAATTSATKLEIWIEADGTPHWSIDGTEITTASITKKMTASSHYLSSLVRSAAGGGGAAKTASIDYLELEKEK